LKPSFYFNFNFNLQFSSLLSFRRSVASSVGLERSKGGNHAGELDSRRFVCADCVKEGEEEPDAEAGQGVAISSSERGQNCFGEASARRSVPSEAP
jgi:hypothetical protein